MVSVDGAFLFRRRASHFDDSPTHFDLFRSISIYFNLFQSFSIISIYFDQFDLFRSISILASKSPKHFDRAGHFDLFRYKIKIAKIKPVRHPARYPRGRMRASHS
jgi:hypothetical protein